MCKASKALDKFKGPVFNQGVSSILGGLIWRIIACEGGIKMDEEEEHEGEGRIGKKTSMLGTSIFFLLFLLRRKF